MDKHRLEELELPL